MIRVSIHNVNHVIRKIKVTGHAQSGPVGHDLICAAVSAIATGALNALVETQNENVHLIYREGEDALIEINVLESNESLQTALRFMIYQLKTVEDSHPKNIRIKEESA